MAELAELARGLLVGNLGDLGEVGTGGEDERLAGDGDGVDLTGGARSFNASSVFAYSRSETGPRVFGLVWSRPLSRVTSARVLPPESGMSRTYECVTTSSSELAVSGPKSMVV